MCDYSMRTRGFASPEETEVVVCLLPGTELAFEHNQTCQAPAYGGAKTGSSTAAGMRS
jgi:hypothetical protein